MFANGEEHTRVNVCWLTRKSNIGVEMLKKKESHTKWRANIQVNFEMMDHTHLHRRDRARTPREKSCNLIIILDEIE